MSAVDAGVDEIVARRKLFNVKKIKIDCNSGGEVVVDEDDEVVVDED